MCENRVGNKHARHCMAQNGQFASICQFYMTKPYFSCLKTSAKKTAASFLLLSYCLAKCSIDYKVDYYWTICKPKQPSTDNHQQRCKIHRRKITVFLSKHKISDIFCRAIKPQRFAKEGWEMFWLAAIQFTTQTVIQKIHIRADETRIICKPTRSSTWSVNWEAKEKTSEQ
jgi:hypothetical protein